MRQGSRAGPPTNGVYGDCQGSGLGRVFAHGDVTISNPPFARKLAGTRGWIDVGGDGHGDDIEAVYSSEVIRITCVHWQAVGKSGGGDHRVVRTSAGLATALSQRRGDSAKCPRGLCIERQRIEVCLGLLKVRLAGGALGIR